MTGWRWCIAGIIACMLVGGTVGKATDPLHWAVQYGLTKVSWVNSGGKLQLTVRTGQDLRWRSQVVDKLHFPTERPVWSPTGHAVYYPVNLEGQEPVIEAVDIQTARIRTYRTNLSRQARIERLLPSPGDGWLAYRVYPDGQLPQPALLNLSDGKELLFPYFLAWEELDWSPNGKYLVFPESDGDVSLRGLRLVAVGTGTVQKLTQWADQHAVWLPDSRRLLFVRSWVGARDGGLLLYDLQTHRQTVLEEHIKVGEPIRVDRSRQVATATTTAGRQVAVDLRTGSLLSAERWRK